MGEPIDKDLKSIATILIGGMLVALVMMLVMV